MSSFITSLLTDLGFRPREPSPHQHPQVESPSTGQTNPPCTNSDQTAGLRDKHSEVESNGGDAGSRPEPPFFPTLPKDMDGRSPDAAANQRLPTGPVASQMRSGNRADTIHDIGMNSTTGDHQSSLAQDSESSVGTHGRQGMSLGNEHVPTDARHDSGRSLEIDELGQMSLPADDGMGWLRNKIHDIRGLDLENNEKARRIHDLMTESYNSCRPLPPHSPTLTSPNQDFATIATSLAGNYSPGSPALHSPTSISQELRLLLTDEDLQPTYVPKVDPESPVAEALEVTDEDPDTEELDEAILGCPHYMRNVKLQCFTCKKWYTCRFCHDAVEDHNLVRRDTENMLCMLCGHAQPAAQHCSRCEEPSAQYYCDICKLWDNDGKKSIYHCNDCGICRIGQGLGKDFFHCKVCCQILNLR